MRPHLYWTHIILTTYGAWLLGDARGFRTRDHREHVEGDYKNPPARGKYEKRAANSRRALSREPVRLTPEQRAIVGNALREKLERLDCAVAALSVSASHMHVMAGLPRGNWKHVVGVAKRHTWFELHEQTGFTGDLWAKGSKVIPLRDRAYQTNVYLYIRRHAEQGAWLWLWKDRNKGETIGASGSVAHGQPPVGFKGLTGEGDDVTHETGGAS